MRPPRWWLGHGLTAAPSPDSPFCKLHQDSEELGRFFLGVETYQLNFLKRTNMYIIIYKKKKTKKKCRYLNTLGKFMHAYSVFPPERWMCSIQDTKWQKPHWNDRSSSIPAREQVVPSLAKSGVSHVSDRACGWHGAAGAVFVSLGGHARGSRVRNKPCPGRHLLTPVPPSCTALFLHSYKTQTKNPPSCFIYKCVFLYFWL